MFSHLLCPANAIHNFKWVNIIRLCFDKTEVNDFEIFFFDRCHALSLECLKAGIWPFHHWSPFLCAECYGIQHIKTGFSGERVKLMYVMYLCGI